MFQPKRPVMTGGGPAHAAPLVVAGPAFDDIAAFPARGGCPFEHLPRGIQHAKRADT